MVEKKNQSPQPWRHGWEKNKSPQIMWRKITNLGKNKSNKSEKISPNNDKAPEMLEKKAKSTELYE